MRDPRRLAGQLDAAGMALIARALDRDPARRPTARELYAYLHGVVPSSLQAMMPPVSGLRVPVRPLAGVSSDAPSVEDLLRAGSDAETLADLIAATETAAPLAIALIGEWGSGKSSLMLQIQRRIDALAEMSRNDPGRSMFAANVRQVRFNAWDYSDDHVWAGITEHLFHVLAADSGIPASPADPEAVGAERARLRRLLADREAEERRLAGELRAADEAAIPRGYLAGLSSPARAGRIMAAAVRELGGDVRGSWKILLGWAVLGAVAAGAWVMWGLLIGAAASAVAVVASPAVAVAQRLRDWQRAGTRIVDGQLSRLDARQRRLQREITRVKEQLAVADAASRLSTFLADRRDGGAYGQYRSLLGRVRTDLGQLSADLAQARREWIADGAPGLPPLERIVLYIDDLDRCPPRKVVEVLEAVHLMLALDLFVVVVAVDARWLIKSLQHHYRDLFGNPAGPAVPGVDDDMATPADYLDKIFQIPFALTPPSPDTFAYYLRSLLPLPSEPKSAQASEPSPEGTDSSSDEVDAVSAAQDKPGDAPGRDTGQASVTQPSIPDIGIPELRPSGLQLMRHEVEFISRMSALLPTPRAAKKLVNLYRLVRIGVSETERAQFVGTGYGGPYQVVQIILAMLVSSPDAAHEIFQQIMNASADEGIIDVLRVIQADGVRSGPSVRLAGQVAGLAEQNPTLTDVREYQRWCPMLARYSFHTRKLAAAAPPARDRRPDAHSPSGAPAASKPSVMPFYLVCDMSVKTDLHTVNQSLGHLRKAIAAEPLVDDIARICVISFADSAEIVLPIGSVGRPVPSLKEEGGEANYGAAFHLLAKTIRRDIAQFREANYRPYRPCVFFFTVGAPRDRYWAAAFKRSLTFNSQKQEGMEEYPIFIPVGLRGAPKEVIRRLAYPPAKSRWYHADENKIEDALGGIIQIIMKTFFSGGSDFLGPAALPPIDVHLSQTPGVVQGSAEDWI